MCSCVTGGARVYSLCELMPYDVRGCVSVTTCGHGPVYCASSYVLWVRVFPVFPSPCLCARVGMSRLK